MIILTRLAGFALLSAMPAVPALAQDTASGAMLYLRLASDGRSCVSCHGPDPGLSQNNILRGADNPDAILKAMNSVSPMGFLRSQLSDTDRADIAAYLGSVSRLNAASTSLRMWPVTLDFGSVSAGQSSAMQRVRIVNPSAQTALVLGSLSASVPELRLMHDCPATLAPSGACDMAVQLRPGGSGLVRGAVQVSAAGQSQVVGAAGYGVTTSASALEWRNLTGTLAFDATSDAQPVRQTLSLYNPGPMPAVLGQTSITGPQASQFKVESGCAQGSMLVAGTPCDLVLSFTPGAVGVAQAMLQLRSDQTNPSATRLQGTVSAPAQVPVAPVAPPVSGESGGGCSVASPGSDRRDATLMAALLAAAALLWGRRRRR